MPAAALADLAGYAGLVPFVAALLGVGLLPDFMARDLAQRGALAWGAVILAYVGAVHWGLALGGRIDFDPRRIGASVLPSVVGAVAVLVGGQRGLALLVLGFGVFWMYERHGVGGELPPHYLALRRNLSLAVCMLLALTMIVSDWRGLA